MLAVRAITSSITRAALQTLKCVSLCVRSAHSHFLAHLRVCYAQRPVSVVPMMSIA